MFKRADSAEVRERSAGNECEGRQMALAIKAGVRMQQFHSLVHKEAVPIAALHLTLPMPTLQYCYPHPELHAAGLHGALFQSAESSVKSRDGTGG